MDEITYTMIGADGAQYGPATLFDFRRWISEGRVVAASKVMRSDTQSWLPASSYPELDLAPVAAPMPASTPPPISPTRGAPAGGVDPALARRMRRGASWFYTIAVLSVINVCLMMAHAGINFIFGHLGLGILAREIVHNAGGSFYAGAAAYLVISGIFAVFGFFAHRGQSWSFIVGGLLYAVDALLVFLVQDWLVLAFHAYVLFWIFAGLQANLALKKSLNR